MSPFTEDEGLLALTDQPDVMLAELWDNDKDAAYDQGDVVLVRFIFTDERGDSNHGN